MQEIVLEEAAIKEHSSEDEGLTKGNISTAEIKELLSLV